MTYARGWIVACGIALAPAMAMAQRGSAVTVNAKPVAGAPVALPGSVATTTIAAGAKYRAGTMRRWFMGESYRELWTTAMQVPMLDLSTYAGGLTPLKAGGGMQTKSLRLVTRDGTEYVFRCVQKDHAWSVPDAFKGSFVEAMSRDQVSASHPAAALVAAPLLEAAGVLHATPILVVMPVDAPLGKFAEDFAGELGIIEMFPHKPDSAAGFAGATQVIDSEELLKKLNEDPAQRVDAPAYLAARLTDMLLGDWDRHPGQWKWARMHSGGHSPWVAIPRDRDMAFVTYEGMIAKVGHLFSPVSARFTGSSATVGAATWNSLELDRRLLGGLDKATWDSVAADITRRLTDDVIERAVAMLPVEYRASAPRLDLALKGRRTRLPGLATALYGVVFDVADIHTSDAAERATITLVSDGIVDVRVVSANGTASFSRRFDAGETREIRLYLHGGDDTAVVVGDVGRSIPVRVIGGNGTNTLLDSATVNGRHARTFLYDTGTAKGVSYGLDTLFNRRHWEMGDTALGPPARDRGTAIVPFGGISSHRGMGLTPRIGLARYTYGFETRPYASRLGLEAAYAISARAYRVAADLDRRIEGSPVHFTALARVSTLEVIHYYGLGNTTADSGGASKYFGARQRQILVHPAIAIALGERSDVSFGPIVQYSATDSAPGQFLSSSRPYGFGRFGQAGLEVTLRHDLADRAKNPEQRLVATVDGTFFPALLDVKRAYEKVSLALEGAVTLRLPTEPLFVFRTGGTKVFGTFPFHDGAFIGGNHTARYMEAQRFGGDASMYASSELRIPVVRAAFIVPFDAGIVGLAEGGRVYVNGASPGGWHSVVGGGIWFSLRNLHMQAITMTMTNENGRSGVHVRTGLGF